MHVKYIQLANQKNVLDERWGYFVNSTDTISKKAVKKQTISKEKNILFCIAGIFFLLKNNKIIIISINNAAMS